LQIYLAEAATGFRTTQGRALQQSLRPFQSVALDADQSGGLPSISDARFLSRVNFNLLRFLQQPAIRPVQHFMSAGLVTVNITTTEQGDLSSEADRTVVYAILSSAHADAVAMASDTQALNTTSVAFGPRAVMARMLPAAPTYDTNGALERPDTCARYFSPIVGLAQMYASPSLGLSRPSTRRSHDSFIARHVRQATR